MSCKNIDSVVSVISVEDFEEAAQWYKKLIGRDPDLTPMEGIAEWQLAENAWIQVAIDPERAGKSTVIIGVHDVVKQREQCLATGLAVGEVVEYPSVIKMAEISDPEGNKIAFVEDISNA